MERPLPPSLPDPATPLPPPRQVNAAPRRGGFIRNNLIVVVVAAIVLGIAGVAVATGKPSRPSLALTSAPAAQATDDQATSTTTIPSAPAKTKPAAYGQTTVQIAGRQVTVSYDAGLVTGLTYGAITITHPNTTSATLVINAATRYRPAGARPKVGERAIVYSTNGIARLIVVRAPLA